MPRLSPMEHHAKAQRSQRESKDESEGASYCGLLIARDRKADCAEQAAVLQYAKQVGSRRLLDQSLSFHRTQHESRRGKAVRHEAAGRCDGDAGEAGG